MSCHLEWALGAALAAMALGCSSESTAPGRDGEIERDGEVSTDLATDAGESIDDRGIDAATSDTDSTDGGCFPACFVRVTAACPRPVSGTCVSQSHGTYTTYCYPGGVHETLTISAGGAMSTYAFAKSDGAACFKVIYTTANARASYYDSSGALVATIETVMPSEPGSPIAVTCDGMTTVIAADRLSSPACRRLGESDCTAGTCQ